MKRHWRNNWPFYAVMVPMLAMMAALTCAWQWRHDARVDHFVEQCALVGRVAIEAPNGGFVCVEAVEP